MKWLEVIKIRAARTDEGLLEEVVQELARAGRNRGLLEMKTYRHALLDSDISVHLHWRSAQVEENGSIPGLQLARALKDFGLVDHSIWIEEEK